jgi:hypothetical protein
MHVHPDAFRAIVSMTLGSERLGTKDAIAIVGMLYIALDADDREDPDELATVSEISDQVGALAGTKVEAPGERATDDYERLEKIRKLGSQLSGPPSRELAYALCYVVSIADLDLAPAETELLADLAVALGISDDRAAELAALVAKAVTPPA